MSVRSLVTACAHTNSCAYFCRCPSRTFVDDFSKSVACVTYKPDSSSTTTRFRMHDTCVPCLFFKLNFLKFKCQSYVTDRLPCISTRVRVHPSQNSVSFLFENSDWLISKANFFCASQWKSDLLAPIILPQVPNQNYSFHSPAYGLSRTPVIPLLIRARTEHFTKTSTLNFKFNFNWPPHLGNIHLGPILPPWDGRSRLCTRFGCFIWCSMFDQSNFSIFGCIILKIRASVWIATPTFFNFF